MFSLNLFVPNCVLAMEFYKNVFGAVAIHSSFNAPTGFKSAQFKIGDANFAMADENADLGSKSPITLGAVSMCIQIDVEDVIEWNTVDKGFSPKIANGVLKIVEKALKLDSYLIAPSTEDKPLCCTKDGVQFCNLKDPFGFIWSLCRTTISSKSQTEQSTT
ncbi:MAG: hypothetical protein LBU60_06140 [Clostridiales bacterium]|jgi:uncharacterized glyoxalase superfamily protein PhnB|nr:hypothetical protein [Clostridiales bacterium]